MNCDDQFAGGAVEMAGVRCEIAHLPAAFRR